MNHNQLCACINWANIQKYDYLNTYAKEINDVITRQKITFDYAGIQVSWQCNWPCCTPALLPRCLVASHHPIWLGPTLHPPPLSQPAHTGPVCRGRLLRPLLLSRLECRRAGA
jgi:hypothetical protein